MICDLPAGLQSENIERPRLLGAEVAQGRVRHVVRLQIELVERGQELGDGADTLVGHVDAVVDGDAHEAGMKGRPQALLGDLVAASNLQLVEALQELQESLQATVAYVATTQGEAVEMFAAVGKVLDEVKDVGVVSVQEDGALEAAELEGEEIVLLHVLSQGVVVGPGTNGATLEDRPEFAPKGRLVEHFSPSAAHLGQEKALLAAKVPEEPDEEFVIRPKFIPHNESANNKGDSERLWRWLWRIYACSPLHFGEKF